MAHWFKLGRLRKHAVQDRIDLEDPQALLALLEPHRTDVGDDILERLGFHVGLWNGEDDFNAARISISCGSYTDCLPYPNNVIIDLPLDLGAFSDANVGCQLLKGLTNIWEPDCGGLFSGAALLERKAEFGEPFVDWVVYLKREWLPKPPHLEPPARIETTDSGTFVIVQPEPPDPRNEDHVRNIRRVEEKLRALWRIPKK